MRPRPPRGRSGLARELELRKPNETSFCLISSKRLRKFDGEIAKFALPPARRRDASHGRVHVAAILRADLSRVCVCVCATLGNCANG